MLPAAPDEDENMSVYSFSFLHLSFLFLSFSLRRRLKSCRRLQDRPSCPFGAPDEDENGI